MRTNQYIYPAELLDGTFNKPDDVFFHLKIR